MFHIFGYDHDNHGQYLGSWDSFANAISAAGTLFDSCAYMRVTVEVETSRGDNPSYTVVYTV